MDFDFRFSFIDEFWAEVELSRLMTAPVPAVETIGQFQRTDECNSSVWPLQVGIAVSSSGNAATIGGTSAIALDGCGTVSQVTTRATPLARSFL